MKNILAALLVLVLFQSSAHATDKIRIAVPDPNAAYMTFPLAQKKGFLAAAGFDAEIVLMRGTLTIPALNADDIDYLTGLPVGVRGTVAGFPFTIVACYLPKSSLMVISRPEITSVKELKGKTAAVSSFGAPIPERCS